MARLIFTIEVDIDPTLNDPLAMAEDVIETYNEDRHHQYEPGPEVELISADWI